MHTLEDYPNNHFKVIEKDLNRTFPSESYYTAEIKESIKRVLRAYVWRNPTVGYIQGMNYLVFRLWKVLQTEEETFWTFAMVVETYMPPDYYVDMYGAISSAAILSRVFKQYKILPEVRKAFD